MTSPLHLAKRFFGALSRSPIGESQIELVQTTLLDSEFALWSAMMPMDKKHSIKVMSRFMQIYPQATATQVRASLLHDVGKLESNLGVFARVLATIVGERGSRFAKYHAHEKIGAQMLRQAGSDEETWQLVAGEVSDSPQLQTVLAALRQADEI
ncbi:MAG: HD domain-containing protein [Ilumatobacteraceae bacterium]|nr:HD domain-containing protein [Ilumatobacteraceae bacterium]